MIADLGAMAGEFAASKRDADAAVEFAKSGPRKLDELRVDMDDKSFSSFDAFKKIDLSKFYGPAGDGYQYHHIVEQSAEGDVSAGDLNSTSNIVRIPKLLHEEINSEYAKTERGAEESLRVKLKGKSFEERRVEGLKVMRNIGIIE